MTPPPPLPFALPRNAVPIIGQPFVLKSWFPTVVGICNCGGGEPVLLVGTAPGVCPSCNRRFVVAQVQFNAQDNTLNIGIGIVREEPPPS